MRHPWFGPLTEATFHHEQLLTPTTCGRALRSVSHVAVLPPDDRSACSTRSAPCSTDPADVGREQLALPYRVDAYWAERS